METTENRPDPAEAGGADAGIVFDTVSGISEEEQREILAGIEGIAGANRMVPSPLPLKAEAKKRGFLFPLLVNICALLLLGGGFFALFVFHGQERSELREGSAGLGLTERKLIEEIRKETAGQLEVKEQEIAGMTDKLAGIDRDLQNLQASIDKRLADKEAELRRIMNDEFEAERQRLAAQNLSEAVIAEEMRKFDAQRITRLNTDLATYRQQLEAEKLASEANFRRLQEEYRNNLAALQNERSLILEASRAREAILHAQAESRVGELSNLYEQSSADLKAAREELSRLALDQERSALIEGQLNGYYIEFNRQIQGGLLKEAAGTLEAMGEFLNTPAFLYIPSLQSRREFHLAAVDALSSMVEAALQGGFTPAPADNSAEIADYENTIAELRAQNTRLEQTLGDQRQTIAAYTSEGTSLSRQLAEFENTITTLRDQTLALNNETAELKNQVADLQSQAAAREQNLRNREAEIASLQTRAAAQEQRLQGEITGLQTKNAEQTKQLAEKDTTIVRLNSEKAKVEEEYKDLQRRVNTALGVMFE
ncbi:MAG: hypothetical protein LBP43_01230 [Treponema sp.]|nr:hypothetical protein [Treponema sp.]